MEREVKGRGREGEEKRGRKGISRSGLGK